MKLLLVPFLFSVGFAAMAQRSTPETISLRITDTGKTYSISIEGNMNGRPIYYDRTFNVRGMLTGQKDALKDRIMDSLRTGKISARRSRPLGEPNATVFLCETCTGRMKLQVSGNGVSMIREEYPQLGETSMFPLTMTLKPGEYQLMYWQNKVMQIQATFTVKAVEQNEVRIK